MVPSYDGYADLWPIAAELFKRFWADRQWPMYWMTNGAAVPEIAKSIAVPVVERTEWGYNIARALEYVSQPFVLFWLDDTLLLSKVPTELVKEAAGILKSHSDIASIALTRYYQRPETATVGSFTDYPPHVYGFSSALPTLFRKEVLLHLLRTLPHGNLFEQQSGLVMFRDMPKMRCLVSTKPMFRFCDNALLHGPWTKCAVNHLNEMSLQVDFSIRGISDEPCRFMDGTPA